MTISSREADAAMQQAERLFDTAQVTAAIDRMAGEIAADLGDADPLVLCVMNGGLVLGGLLLPRLDFVLRLDYLHATRYRNRTFGDDLHWRKHPEHPLAGETVLVVDDILDEGHTLAAILDYCRAEGAKHVVSAVLVEKRRARDVDLRPDYIGLEVPDRYVFGFGMDYKGYWRNAAGIYAASES
jgi:hypoxanthine phosphoribosyltransferase